MEVVGLAGKADDFGRTQDGVRFENRTGRLS